jgi:hypothetical protein
VVRTRIGVSTKAKTAMGNADKAQIVSILLIVYCSSSVVAPCDPAVIYPSNYKLSEIKVMMSALG